MPSIGTASQPLRVAVIGAGPAAFYAADHLLKQTRAQRRSGHVRPAAGAARARPLRRRPGPPEDQDRHRAYDATAANPRFRFFGNVELGRHVTLEICGGTTTRSCSRPARRPTGAWAFRAKTSPGAMRRRSSWPGTTGIPTTASCQFDLVRRARRGRGRRQRGDRRGTHARAHARRARRPPTSPTTRSTRCARAVSARSSCSAGAARHRRRSPTPRSRKSARWPTRT